MWFSYLEKVFKTVFWHHEFTVRFSNRDQPHKAAFQRLFTPFNRTGSGQYENPIKKKYVTQQEETEFCGDCVCYQFRYKSRSICGKYPN